MKDNIRALTKIQHMIARSLLMSEASAEIKRDHPPGIPEGKLALIAAGKITDYINSVFKQFTGPENLAKGAAFTTEFIKKLTPIDYVAFDLLRQNINSTTDAMEAERLVALIAEIDAKAVASATHDVSQN